MGKLADVITVDLRCPNLVYSASGAEVDNVFINGGRAMDNGRLFLVDKSALTSEADNRAAHILQSRSRLEKGRLDAGTAHR